MAIKISAKIKLNRSHKEKFSKWSISISKKIATERNCCYFDLRVLRKSGYRTMNFLELASAISKHPDIYHTAVRTAEL